MKTSYLIEKLLQCYLTLKANGLGKFSASMTRSPSGRVTSNMLMGYWDVVTIAIPASTKTKAPRVIIGTIFITVG